MTASLLSTQTNESQYDNHNHHRKSKKRTVTTTKYSINNLLFSKLNPTTTTPATSSNANKPSPVVELTEIIKTTAAVSSSSLAEDTASSTGSSPPSSYDNSPTSRPNRQHNKLEVNCDVVETVCLLEKQPENSSKVADSQIQVNSTTNNFSSFGRNARVNNYGQVKMGQLKINQKLNVETGNTVQDDSLNAEACSLGNFLYFLKNWIGNDFF